MLDLTPLIEAVIGLAVALITYKVIPWIKGKIEADKLNKILTYIKIAVQGAEQIYNTEKAGAEKKQYVINYVKSKGFNIDEEDLNAYIESAVLEIKGWL